MRRQRLPVELRLDAELKARYQGRYLDIAECDLHRPEPELVPRKPVRKDHNAGFTSSATPVRLCERAMRVVNRPSKPELSTWLGVGTFYLAPTWLVTAGTGITFVTPKYPQESTEEPIFRAQVELILV
jgi:hypothetical protein